MAVRLAVLVLLAIVVGLSGPLADPSANARGRDRATTPQVVGGAPVPPGSDRFVVALLDLGFSPPAMDQWFCGGTVIASRTVLTAAHCVEGMRARRLAVLVGETSLTGGDGVRIRVERVSVHPAYAASPANAYDVAVLRLRSPIPEALYRPIALPPAGDRSWEQAGTEAFVAGWGDTMADLNYPTDLMQAAVEVWSEAACGQAYPATYVVPAAMLCAEGVRPSRDACTGDSGGPLFVDRGAGAVQIGIVSKGPPDGGCGIDDAPGIYTRLSDPAIATWITTESARRKPRPR